MAKTRELNLRSLIASAINSKIKEAGFKTIHRSAKSNYDSEAIHIQKLRQKQIISIQKHDMYRDNNGVYGLHDLPIIKITLNSGTLKNIYTVLETNPVDINDPEFKLDVDELAQKIIKFLKKIAEINNLLREADSILNIDYRGSLGYNPNVTKVKSKNGI